MNVGVRGVNLRYVAGLIFYQLGEFGADRIAACPTALLVQSGDVLWEYCRDLDSTVSGRSGPPSCPEL